MEKETKIKRSFSTVSKGDALPAQTLPNFREFAPVERLTRFC